MRYMLLLIPAYLVTHIGLFTEYTATPEASETVKILALLQWFVPVFMLGLTAPKIAKLFAPILRVPFWTAAGLILVVLCVFLETFGLAGLWWSWTTLGLLTLVLFSIANLVTDRVNDLDALLVGVMVMLMAMASWEAIYQTGLLFYHDFFGSGMRNYLVVIGEQFTWIIPATIVLLVMYKKYGRIVRINKLVIACLAISIICTSIWFATGMTIPLYWWKGVGPFVNPDADAILIAVSRGSQSFWLASFILMFLRRDEVEAFSNWWMRIFRVAHLRRVR